MIEQRIYSELDLQHGKCPSCGEVTDEIYTKDGRCIDCIEEERFYNMTMGIEYEDEDIYL